VAGVRRGPEGAIVNPEHEVTPARRLRYPGGKDGMWVSECACGEYRTGVCGTEREALRRVQEHVEAKKVRDGATGP
jgi:hypothetical protein